MEADLERLAATLERERAKPAEEPVPEGEGTPIESPRPRRRVALIAVGTLALLAVVAVVLAVVSRRGPDASEVAAAPAEGPGPLVVPPAPRVAFFGDSTALMTSWGFGEWALQTGDATQVGGVTGLGCSVVRAPLRRVAGEVGSTDAACTDWGTTWRDAVMREAPDVAVVQVGPWDIADVQLDDGGWHGPGDPSFDAFLLDEMVAAVDTLSSNGAVVVWLASPLPGPNTGAPPEWDAATRMSRFNQVLSRLPSVRPERVAVVGLDGWVASIPVDEDVLLRPDGIHFTDVTALDACRRFICGAVLEAAHTLTPPSAPVLPAEVPDGCHIADGCLATGAVDLETGQLPDALTFVNGSVSQETAGARQKTWAYAGEGKQLQIKLSVTMRPGATFRADGISPRDGTAVQAGRRSVVLSHPIVGTTVGAVVGPGTQLTVTASGLSDEEVLGVFGDLVLFNHIRPLPGPTTAGVQQRQILVQVGATPVADAMAALRSAGWKPTERVTRDGETPGKPPLGEDEVIVYSVDGYAVGLGFD